MCKIALHGREIIRQLANFIFAISISISSISISTSISFFAVSDFDCCLFGQKLLPHSNSANGGGHFKLCRIVHTPHCRFKQCN